MLNVALVGHIDHGKSTLIGRLLYDTDSLPESKLKEIKKTCESLGRKFEFAYLVDALEEERKKQMTIETAQTFFKSDKRDYALIDAPGHKEFLKNMVTGVSQADAAILIVDVVEGLQEQTKRHAYLLKLLGIEKLIVVINKMDLVNYEKLKFEKTRNDVVSYLKDLGMKPTCIIPISAYEGDNVVKKSEKMKWYEGPTVLQALDAIEKKEMFYHFRLPIQDEYEMGGEKIYVGNILSGELKKGDVVKCYPEEKEVKIEKIFVYENEVETAKAPQAVGIIVDSELKRGYVLGKGERPLVTRNVSSLLFSLVGDVKEGEKYLMRCVTQKVECKVEKVLEKIDINTLERLSGEELKETEIGKVELSFEKPVVVEKFNKLKELGRFVLMKEGKIIAGGIVV